MATQWPLHLVRSVDAKQAACLLQSKHCCRGLSVDSAHDGYLHANACMKFDAAWANLPPLLANSQLPPDWCRQVNA